MCVDKLTAWLRQRLKGEPLLEVWIYGSVLKKSKFNDVDVFIKYSTSYMAELPRLKDRLGEGFASKFGVPLHLLVLSEEEVLEFEDFLNRALVQAVKIYPN